MCVAPPTHVGAWSMALLLGQPFVYCGVFIEKYVCTKFHRNCFVLFVSELHGHICCYCNLLPEAVYCCFTRTTLFTKLFTCLYDQSLWLLSHHQALLLYTLDKM